MIPRKPLAAALVLCSLMICQTQAQSPNTLARLQSQYDQVLPYVDNGMIVVCKEERSRSGGSNKRFGYVDTLGREIVPPKYDHGVRFRNRFAVVSNNGVAGDKKCGLIDLQGREIVPLTWDAMSSVNSGVSVAYNRTSDSTHKYVLIDTLGHHAPISYDLCRDFKNSYAIVGSGVFRLDTVQSKRTSSLPGTRPSRTFVGKYGYITPDGKLAIPIQYDAAQNFDSEGLAAVGMQGKYYIKWGFINLKGEQVIPCDYYSVENFHNGLAVVSKVAPTGQLVYGYIDPAGQAVVECKYAMAYPFNFENAWVGVQRGEEMVYVMINAKGLPVLPFPVLNLQFGGKFGQAIAAVKDPEGKLLYGLLDNSGAMLLPFEYDQMSVFSDLDPQTNKRTERVLATKNGREYKYNLTQKKP